jgi:hypothetical protein
MMDSNLTPSQKQAIEEAYKALRRCVKFIIKNREDRYAFFCAEMLKIAEELKQAFEQKKY